MISWHLMSAFYPQLPWYRCGLARIDENKFQTEKAFHVLSMIIMCKKIESRLFQNTLLLMLSEDGRF